MSYNKKYRKQALEYLQTHTYEKTAKVFGVSINALVIWEKKLEATGSLENIPRKNVCPKIDPKNFKNILKNIQITINGR